MASTIVLLLLLLLVSLASAHHMGGTATVTYRGKNPDGSVKMDFRYRSTFDTCQYGHTWNCSSGNCGVQSSLRRSFLDNSTSDHPVEMFWCEAETVESRNITSYKPFEMRANGCCWIPTNNSVTMWSLLTRVDLGTRSDTKEPNRSPDIAIIPFLRVPYNCPWTYKLVNFDPDGDKVRCRYGNSRNKECDKCDRPVGFILDEDSCTLQYNKSTYSSRVYGFQVVVEDFPQSSINVVYSNGAVSLKAPVSITPVPFSKLPLHFSLLVDDSVPSCTVGDYLPKFLNPTPDNGAHIQAEVNKEVEIRVKAQATYSEIQNVIFSGPQGITKRQISTGEFAITWTPGPDDLGQHYVICFLVESTSESRDYQSDMRCVIMDVRHRIVEAHVICSQSEMIVEVDKSTIPQFSVDNLRLIDSSCGLISNDTHIIGSIPLNACGTEIEQEDDTFLKFKNEITSFDNRGDVITRKQLLEVQFYCQYPIRGKVMQNFLAHRNATTVWEKGMGKFTYEFELYDDDTFQNMLDPNSYPLEFGLGEQIYMQITATSSVPNIRLFVESCTAAPYDNPNSKPVYPIIENGCIEDSTVVAYASAPSKYRFSIEAFKFIGLQDQVFISCSVLICRLGEPDTRCAKGCISPPQPDGSSHGRRRRAVVTQSSLHRISQGPLCAQRRKRSLNPVGNASLNVIFIAGCLVGAVGTIIGATKYFSKISKMKYQPLATQEN